MGMLMRWSHSHPGSVLEDSLDKQTEQHHVSLLTLEELPGLACCWTVAASLCIHLKQTAMDPFSTSFS